MITEEGFMDIIAMHHSGLRIQNISRTLGIHINTVKKHIEGKAFPHYLKRKRIISILEPYKHFNPWGVGISLGHLLGCTAAR
jgi:transposase